MKQVWKPMLVKCHIQRVCLLFVGLISSLVYAAHADYSDSTTVSGNDWYANEPDLPLRESALASEGLYDEFLHNQIKNSDIAYNMFWSCRPTQIHLSIGKDAWSSMTVSFTIPKRCANLEDFSINVFYGSNLDKLKNYQIDPGKERLQYNYTSTSFPFYESGSIFHVKLTDLQPSTKYFYRIFVQSKSNAFIHQLQSKTNSNSKYLRHRELMNKSFAHHGTKSPLLSFRTSYPPGASKGTKMAIVADLGQTYNSTITMLHMYRHSVLDWDPMAIALDEEDTQNPYIPASIILCAGDMSYADTNQFRWDRWFNLIEPLISKVPIQVIPGNHEMECDIKSYESFTPYASRFAMPSHKAGYRNGSTLPCEQQGSYTNTTYSYEYGNAYYAFTQGLTRVIMLNSYSYIFNESDQYQWLVKELNAASANRENTPWIIVMVHVPLYNTFSAHQDELTTLHMLDMVEPLFVDHRINLVISGHAHGYSRSTNVAYGELIESAPIYITVGEGGNREQHSKTYRNAEPENWVVKRDITEYGFGTLEFLNATFAQWKWVRNEHIISSHFKDEAFIKNQYYL